MSWEFLLTTLVVVASPGTGAIYTFATGLSGGARASFVAAVGCTLGTVPHMIAAIGGVAAAFQASEAAFQALKLAGVAYLLFMAWSMLRAGGPLSVQKENGRLVAWEVAKEAIVLNILNPKLSIFFLASLPQFVAADDPEPVARMILLSLVFMAVTFIVFAAYGVFASSLRRHVLGNLEAQRWMRRGFAAAFTLLALQLAFAKT